jgi:hypothetical protein
MSSKATKGKKQSKEFANQKLSSAMTQSNLKFVMDKPMLIINMLNKVGQAYVDLHNYYINKNKLGEDIIVSYKDHHFLVGDDFFFISFSDLYDLFNLDTLDVSLMHSFVIVSLQKLPSSLYSIYMFYVSIKFGIFCVGTCNNKLFIKWERSLLHNLTRK